MRLGVGVYDAGRGAWPGGGARAGDRVALLAPASPQTDNDAEADAAEAARVATFERAQLRAWATKRGKGGAMLRASKKTMQVLMARCKEATPAWRDVVLSHFMAVENPSKARACFVCSVVERLSEA